MIITLLNSEIKLTIRPDLGGRIDQLQDLQTEHQWLWHPKGYDESQTRTLAFLSSFDDNWTGGWDEIFPNDAAGVFQGRHLVATWLTMGSYGQPSGRLLKHPITV
ncbi:hypothetical protein [Scytonema sp. PCC 10023]|uniref:hypothetical protein n=1 Tax=Scytonema sp. PCC 10023 TaxID=1680591 RepID=UPI0039C5DC0A